MNKEIAAFYWIDGETHLHEGDIVEAIIKTDRGDERMTEIVYLGDNGKFQFGQLGNLAESKILRHVGNQTRTPWPIERPAV